MNKKRLTENDKAIIIFTCTGAAALTVVWLECFLYQSFASVPRGAELPILLTSCFVTVLVGMVTANSLSDYFERH